MAGLRGTKAKQSPEVGKMKDTTRFRGGPGGPPDISDDAPDTSWSKMEIARSTDDSSMIFLRSKKGIAIVAASLLLLCVIFSVIDHKSSTYSPLISKGGDDESDDVAPIFGQANLTPDEYKNIRTAHPHESVLITGGLGFIGSHVVDLLLHRGFKVTILDDESNGHNHNKYAKEMVPNDITVVGGKMSVVHQIGLIK